MSVVPVEKGTAVKSAEEIKREITSEERSPETEAEKLDEPRLKERYSFDFSYTDLRGRVWKGPFVNQILNGMDVCRVAVVRSRILGGVALESIDNYTFEHAERLAHLTVSLSERASWAEGDKLSFLYDPRIIAELYKEVASHEAIFHGREPDQKTGASRGKDAAGEAAGMVEG